MTTTTTTPVSSTAIGNTANLPIAIAGGTAVTTPPTTANTTTSPATTATPLVATSTTDVLGGSTALDAQLVGPTVTPVQAPTQVTGQQAQAITSANATNPNFGNYGITPSYSGPGIYATGGNFYVVNTPAEFTAIEPNNPVISNVTGNITIPTTIPVNNTPTAAPLPSSVPADLTLTQVTHYFGNDLGADAIAYINGVTAAGQAINSQALANAIVQDQAQGNATTNPVISVTPAAVPTPTATLNPDGSLTINNVGVLLLMHCVGAALWAGLMLFLFVLLS